MTPFRIFIGYDDRESEAFHVLSHSILRHASIPVSITPIVRAQVRRIHDRPRGLKESTDFSLTRFLVPYLCGYEGHGLFLDCDMLVQADVLELLPYCDEKRAVWVCPHDYETKAHTKFLGQRNEAYPRKNWSSCMLFNAALCKQLTPAYVNTATPLELHRLQWVDDAQVGHLPIEWNWLVGEYPANPEAKNLHFTLGTPGFPEYATCDHADRWLAERERMRSVAVVA